MVNIQSRVIIPRPLSVVYKAFIEPGNMLQWSTGLEKMEPVSGNFGEPGATAHMHIRQNGKAYLLRDELISCEPEQFIISEVSGPGIHARVETRFEKVDEGCRIIIKWSGSGTSLISRLFLPLARKKIRKLSLEELNKFKSLVEQYGVKFPEKV